MSNVTPLADNLHAIDLNFQGQQGVIAAYLIEDAGEKALVEVGPGSTVDNLLAGLRELDVDPDDITSLLVTHVHLDHAGAAGTLVRLLPRARLYVHEIGAPHLIDPTKLVASATRIYGDMMGPLWGDIEPVPAERMTVLTEGSTVRIGGRTLTARYTPGHASHHVAFHEVNSGAVFTGDVAGVRLQGIEYVRPPTPPPDLDLELWSTSLDLLIALRPQALYLTHFGKSISVESHLDETRERLFAWAELLRGGKANGLDRDALIEMLRERGDAEILEATGDQGAATRFELATPYFMSVDGYLRYFRRADG